MKFNFEGFFGGNNNASRAREQIIKQQNRLEELNLLVLYEILEQEGEEEGEEKSAVYLYDNPRVIPSEELYYDAMTKLDKIVEGNTKIKNIKKIFAVKDKETVNFFEKMGFMIYPISKATAFAYNMLSLNYCKSDEQKYAIAIMGREEFLERFTINTLVAK